MPYVAHGRALIADVYRRRFALPAFNVCSAEMARACISAAAELSAPIVLQAYPDDLEQIPPEPLVALVRSLADAGPAPVLLHLDHGRDAAMARTCLGAGFGSVMLDGAGMEPAALLREARALAAVADAQGAALEVAAESFDHDAAAPTEPAFARRLHREGHADMVAVSVGSEHGRTAQIDLERLERIASRVCAPLVLHGGSGIAADDLRAARALGVSKVNVGSALYRSLRAVWEGSSDAPSHRAVYARARAALGNVARERIRACGAEGRSEVVAA